MKVINYLSADKKIRKLYLVLGLLLLVLVPATIAYADQTPEHRIIAGDTESGELILQDAWLVIEQDATFNGDIILWSGNAEIAGTINGDIVLFSGDATVLEGAHINGDCVLLSGIQINEDDNFTCTDFGGIVDQFPFVNKAGLAKPGSPSEPIPSSGRRALGTFLSAIGSSLLMGMLAFVVAVVAPQHLRKVSKAAQQKTMASGTIGALTAVAGPAVLLFVLILSSALLLVCFGILGFPILLAMGVAFIAAILIGWVAIGEMAGNFLTDKLNIQGWGLPLTAAFGTATLTLALNMAQIIPVLGFFAGLTGLVLAAVGLGAATLTKLGTRPYPLVVITANPIKVTQVINTMPAKKGIITIDIDDLED